MGARNNSRKRIRNAYYLSTVSVALVLFLLGTVAYIMMNIQKATDAVLQDIKVSVILNDTLKTESVNKLKADIAQIEGVENITYISKKQAAEDFKNFTGSDFNLFIDDNPLPASLELSLGKIYESKEILAELEDKLLKIPGIDEVLYQRNIIDSILTNIFKFRLITLSFGIALLLASFILISNTIRMAVYSKRFIIKTMKLVGATDAFIRKPFVTEAIVQGLTSAFTAWIMLTGVIIGLNKAAPETVFFPDDFKPLAILYGAIVVCGIIICLLCTNISINKYINLDNNNLHVY